MPAPATAGGYAKSGAAGNTAAAAWQTLPNGGWTSRPPATAAAPAGHSTVVNAAPFVGTAQPPAAAWAQGYAVQRAPAVVYAGVPTYSYTPTYGQPLRPTYIMPNAMPLVATPPPIAYQYVIVNPPPVGAPNEVAAAPLPVRTPVQQAPAVAAAPPPPPPRTPAPAPQVVTLPPTPAPRTPPPAPVIERVPSVAANVGARQREPFASADQPFEDHAVFAQGGASWETYDIGDYTARTAAPDKSADAVRRLLERELASTRGAAQTLTTFKQSPIIVTRDEVKIYDTPAVQQRAQQVLGQLVRLSPGRMNARVRVINVENLDKWRANLLHRMQPVGRAGDVGEAWILDLDDGNQLVKTFRSTWAGEVVDDKGVEMANGIPSKLDWPIPAKKNAFGGRTDDGGGSLGVELTALIDQDPTAVNVFAQVDYRVQASTREARSSNTGGRVAVPEFRTLHHDGQYRLQRGKVLLVSLGLVQNLDARFIPFKKKNAELLVLIDVMPDPANVVIDLTGHKPLSTYYANVPPRDTYVAAALVEPAPYRPAPPPRPAEPYRAPAYEPAYRQPPPEPTYRRPPPDPVYRGANDRFDDRRASVDAPPREPRYDPPRGEYIPPPKRDGLLKRMFGGRSRPTPADPPPVLTGAGHAL